jgi:hypothetical protein
MIESAMRVSALMAGLVLGAASVCSSALMAIPAQAATAKITCPCDCPQHQKTIPRHTERLRPRPYAGSRYSYRDAMPVHWRVARSEAPGQGESEGLVIDQAGWSGGVGYGVDGGGGYGQLLLVNGAGQNGPTYNSLGESLQQNPSMPHPFQNRVMGGVAPAK